MTTRGSSEVGRIWRLLAILLALAMFAAACGGGDDDDDGADPPDPGGDVDLDPNGVLRIATQINGVSFDDRTTFVGPNQLGIMYHVIGTPLQLEPDGTVGPYLAESYEIPDPTTLKLTLREGITFQNGAPYDAETLKANMIANRESGSQLFDPGITSQITDITVDSPTELTFKLGAPIAGSLPLVLSKAAAYAWIDGPNGFPIGAGPYQIADFTFENVIAIEKWDGFFEADEYDINRVEYLNIPAIEAAQNALQNDQVDLIATNPRDVDSLLQRGTFEKVVTNNEAHLMLATCKATAPFDDVKFREAFDLAINRERLNEVVLGGNARPMTSIWDPGSPFALDLFDTDGDTEAAEELLEEIDWDPGTEIPFGYFATFQTHQLLAEALQGQLDAVGIKLNVQPINPGAINEVVNASTGGAYVIANSQPGVQKIVIPLLTPGSTWNPCDYDDPELREITTAIAAGDATEDELEDLWTEAQEIVAEQYLFVPLLTQPATYVYDTEKVVGLQEGTIGLLGATTPAPYLKGMGIKA